MTKWCVGCKTETDDFYQDQKLCRRDTRDVWSIEKYMKKIKEQALWSTIVNNDELLFLFLTQWREEVEESKGRGFKRVNKFRVAVFKQTVFALQGVQRGGRAALKTLKQFVAQAVEAGRSAAWGGGGASMEEAPSRSTEL